MKKFSHHLKHYIPLLGILTAAFIGFYMFRYDRNFQIILTIAVSSGYFSWGLIHHHLHNDLTRQVVLEYFAIAVLGAALVFSVIFRA